MAQFLGLSLGTWQTLFLFGLPFIFPFFSKLKKSIQAYLYNRKHPKDQSKAKCSQKQTIFSRKVLRKPHTWILIFSIICLLIQTTVLNPNRLNPFTITNNHLKVPSSTLLNSLTKYYRANGIEKLPETQQRLLQKLTSFDARMTFATLGREPLLDCNWCRPPSSRQISQNSDHLIYILPRLLNTYLTFIVVLGMMTTGASNQKMKRRIWRYRLSMATIVLYIFETIILSLITYMPSLMTSINGDRMMWDALFVLRRLIFAIILFIAWWSVVTEPVIESDSVSISKLGLGINNATDNLETLLNRLRILALQRSALMRSKKFRSKTIEFWEDAEQQSEIANKNQRIRSLKEELGLSLTNRTNRDQLKEWIDTLYPDPTSPSSPLLPSSPINNDDSTYTSQ
ncbi:hypothetical protein BY996DRAFT_4575636 [Phakopsora pachyrhizi]|nr:hypothetical protein BY996DRAFT_4575636 [Phakopsora pachyrhizi]